MIDHVSNGSLRFLPGSLEARLTHVTIITTPPPLQTMPCMQGAVYVCMYIYIWWHCHDSDDVVYFLTLFFFVLFMVQVLSVVGSCKAPFAEVFIGSAFLSSLFCISW